MKPIIPIIIIVVGVAISFFAIIRLLKFTNDLSEKIQELNELFSSDAFLLHKELREELDELNFSYYEILERQDERITELEMSEVSPLATEETVRSLDSDANPSVTLSGANDSERSRMGLDDTENTTNARVLAMYKDGKSKEDIAVELDLGIGMVETICSLYGK